MEKQKNIPELRFPGFKGEWEKKKLGDIAEINPKNEKLPKSFVYIDLESVVDGVLLKEDTLEIDNAPSRAQRLLTKGDVLFQMVRPYQKNNLYFDKAGDYVASTGYAQLRISQNSKFIFQYLHFQKFVDKVIEKCTGTSFPAINSTDLSSISIFSPTPPEQTKIASFLSAIDEKLQALKKKKSLLEQYKKGMMQKIFAQQIRFKDDKGKDFPAWEEKKYEDIFSFRTTNSYSRENLNYQNGVIKNIHYGDIHTKFHTLFNIANELVPFINSDIGLSKIGEDNYCKEGDLVIADASEDYDDVGKCIEIVNLKGKKVLAGLHTILARPDIYKMAIGFSGYLMQSENIRLQIKTIAQGSKVLSISSTRLAKIQLIIPSLQEQAKIANFLTAIDKKITHTKTLIEQTELFKKGLLQKMFC